MKKSVFRLFGLGIVSIGIIVILAGCSQGFTSSNSPAPSSPAPVARPAQTTAAPASSGPTSKSTTAYRPVAFNPTVSGSTVTLSMAEVARGNGNFVVNNMPFMAYLLDGKYNVRANLCVPCGSRSFTLVKGELICGSCGTVFNATTGAGVRGVSACMTYAKKPAAYTIEGGNIVMTLDDMTAAYQNTLNRTN